MEERNNWNKMDEKFSKAGVMAVKVSGINFNHPRQTFYFKVPLFIKLDFSKHSQSRELLAE